MDIFCETLLDKKNLSWQWRQFEYGCWNLVDIFCRCTDMKISEGKENSLAKSSVLNDVFCLNLLSEKHIWWQSQQFSMEDYTWRILLLEFAALEESVMTEKTVW